MRLFIILFTLGVAFSSCEPKLSSTDKTNVVKRIETNLVENKEMFNSISSFLDTFTPSYNSVMIFKWEGYKNVSYERFQESTNAKTGFYVPIKEPNYLPGFLGTYMNKLGIRSIKIDSANNYESIRFVSGFSIESEIYLLHIKADSLVIENRERLIEQFNQKESSSWLYIIDKKWAVYSKK